MEPPPLPSSADTIAIPDLVETAGSDAPSLPPLQATVQTLSPIAALTGTSIGNESVSRLATLGIGLNEVLWVVPLSSLMIAGSTAKDVSWLLMTRDKIAHFFNPMQHACAPDSALNADVYCSNGTKEIRITADASSLRIAASVSLDKGSTFLRGVGPWFLSPHWQEGLCNALQIHPDEARNAAVCKVSKITIGQSRLEPAETQYGDQPVVCAFTGDNIVICASCGTFRLEKTTLRSWYEKGNAIVLVVANNSIPEGIMLDMVWDPLLLSWIAMCRSWLPLELRVKEDSPAALRGVGLYAALSTNANVPVEMLIAASPNGITVQTGTGDSKHDVQAGSVLGPFCLLELKNGEVLCVIDEHATLGGYIKTPLPSTWTANGEGELHMYLLKETVGSPLSLARVRLTPGAVHVGDDIIEVNSIGAVDVESTDKGIHRSRIVVKRGDDETTLALLGSEAALMKLWEEIEVRKATLGIQRSTIADLYRQYNSLKRQNLLFVLYADTVILNRQLNDELPMSDLMQRMHDLGSADFADNESLRNITVKKMLTLYDGINEIKRKFERLAMMYPYYWAQEDARWLVSVFGDDAGMKLAVGERKRLVPLVRREVRTVQSNIQRALGEIEGAIRPLESVFARNELQKHRTSRLIRHAPTLLQAGGAATSLMLAAATPLAPLMVVGIATTLTGIALKSFLEPIQKNREMAATVKRVAEAAFPWWDLFMRTLVVTMYESSEFIKEEGDKAMKRDRALLDQLPDDQKKPVLGRLSQALRNRIVDERRNRFVEVMEGSGIRLANVVNDIELAAGDSMRSLMKEVTDGVVVKPRKKH